MVAVVQSARRVRNGVAFRARRQGRFVAWWLRWGWRPYGTYHRYAMDRLALRDPRAAVGGLWDHLGPYQFEYLKRHGLRPEHVLLDIGCGALRGGRHFMQYLEPGHYWGQDISPEILEAGRRLVDDEGLDDREPHLLLTTGFEFREVEGMKFDVVQAFAVFTDVPHKLVDECFANLSKVLAPGGAFFATFVPGDRYLPDPARIGFQYPFQQLQEMGRSHGYSVDLMTDFQHPRGHQMLVARALVNSAVGVT